MSFFWVLSLLLSFTLVSASWKDSYNTIDGSQEVILVVETHSIDLSELGPELTEGDLSSLPFCNYLSSSDIGTTPCRDRPNFFTSIDYDVDSDTFRIITDRGPVVDCSSFPALQSGNNTIGNPNTVGVYVPEYSPAVASFQIDGNTLINYQYTEVTGLNGSLSGLAKSSDEDEMFGPECTNLPPSEYPLPFDPTGISPSSIRQVYVGEEIYYVAVEEFGPSVLVLNSEGEVLKAYVPVNSASEVINHEHYPVSANLPSILLQTQISRSFSALSYDEASETFYVFVEASLGVDQTSTFVRVLQLNGTDLLNIEYTGMYGFELETAKQYITAGGSTSQLPLISVVAADLISDKSFLTIERPLVSDSTSTFNHLDLSNATNLKGAWDQDLQLEQISANNNALLLDNEELNDQYKTNFASLHPPVYLGLTQTLFDSRQVRQWEDYSIDGEEVSSLRVISDTVIVVGIDNHWGFTETSDTFGKLYFIRLGASTTSALVNSPPVAGSAGNALTLSDSSSPDASSQKKKWAYIQQTDASQWDSLGSVFTIELWFYWRGGSQMNDFQPIVSRTSEPSFESAHFIFGVEISGTAGLESGWLRGIVGCSSAVGLDISSTSTISVDEWHHLAFVVSGSSAELFVDNQVSTGIWSSNCGNSPIPAVGNDPRVNLGNFEGLGVNAVIDELRFWSSARTADQIQNWSHNPLSGTESGLVAYYQFNDVPSTQKSPFDFQYFHSTGPANGPEGLIQPVADDKSRFVASTISLTDTATVLAVEADVSTPYQNTITLQATDFDQDPITYSIIEFSSDLSSLLDSDGVDRILFAQPHSALNLTQLPVSLDSNQLTVFVTCNDSLCSNLPSDDQLWFRYNASSEGGSSSATIYLQVESCTELDSCGVCKGDNGQCQCACYHGFTADFMDYTLFSFLLNENIEKINELLDILDPLVGSSSTGYLYHRWQAGHQYTDYTPYVEAQKSFLTQCLDTFCDTFNPFETDFYARLGLFLSAPSDFNTCSCDQSPPDVEDLPPVYSL